VGGASPADDARRVVEALDHVVLGQAAATREALVCLLARGHVLLEGVPGTAKTLLVRTLALALDVKFQRIQFTPDLMPADITGVTLLTGAREFTFRPGPIFADLVLADEINRAPAKTQAALLEAMQERTVTVDGIGYPLSATFTVFATQNPVEFEGTYPLPEAELDRFMMKVLVGYPDAVAEQGDPGPHGDGIRGGSTGDVRRDARDRRPRAGTTARRRRGGARRVADRRVHHRDRPRHTGRGFAHAGGQPARGGVAPEGGARGGAARRA